MKNDPLLILLAEDDEDDRMLFKSAMAELKIQTTVQTVTNGQELMNHLADKSNALPHLIFLDMNMPLKSGMDCLKEIRSNKSLSEVSIAIYSTTATEKDIDETFINGANVYIKKPNNYDVLKQVLRKAVMSAYQYQEAPFNKANFLLRI